MPPSSLVRSSNALLWRRMTNIKLSQRFYPQCTTCSNLQGGLLNGVITSTPSSSSTTLSRVEHLLKGYNHASHFRRYHIIGFILSAITVPSKEDCDRGRPGGFTTIERGEQIIEEGVGGVWGFFGPWIIYDEKKTRDDTNDGKGGVIVCPFITAITI